MKVPFRYISVLLDGVAPGRGGVGRRLVGGLARGRQSGTQGVLGWGPRWFDRLYLPPFVICPHLTHYIAVPENIWRFGCFARYLPVFALQPLRADS